MKLGGRERRKNGKMSEEKNKKRGKEGNSSGDAWLAQKREENCYKKGLKGFCIAQCPVARLYT